jgi:hypothetical protein
VRSGKTMRPRIRRAAACERARVAIIDPLGAWWGLRASADACRAGYPVVVSGDACRSPRPPRRSPRRDLPDLGSNAGRRRFMAALSEALYETNPRAAASGCSTRPICGRRKTDGAVEPGPPRAYQRAFEALLAADGEKRACRTMVGLLALAHERSCEAELADIIDGGRLPDLDVLTGRFAPDPAAPPDISAESALHFGRLDDELGIVRLKIGHEGGRPN